MQQNQPCRRRAMYADRRRMLLAEPTEVMEPPGELLQPRRYVCKLCGADFSYPLALARHSKGHRK